LKVGVVRSSRDLLEVVLEDLDLSILQILQKELFSDDRVTFAAYKRPHPLEKKYYLVLRVREGNPKEVLVEAIKSARDKVAEISKTVSRSLGVEGS
jgi:DNA-directed RNA polymerase subunit L